MHKMTGIVKRALAAALCAALILVSGAALAQSSGNLSAGSFVEEGGGALFVAREDGVYRMAKDGTDAVKIVEGPATALQFYDGRLYYLAQTYSPDPDGILENVLTAQTPMSCLPDGTDARKAGDSRRVGTEQSYNETSSLFGLESSDAYVGYRGFTVYNGAIYFLGNCGEGGSYTSSQRMPDENGVEQVTSADTRYESGIALYKMNLDGSGLTQLTGVLGNSIALMALCDGRIYVAAGYRDALYAYNFVNYEIYDTEGNRLFAFEAAGPEENAFFSDAGAFYHIPLTIDGDGENILVSLAQSEGDFIASEFSRLKSDGTLDTIALELNNIPGVRQSGVLYYVGSESENIFYDDGFDYDASMGIYALEEGEATPGRKLAALPFNEYSFNLKLNVVDGYVYFVGADQALNRVSVEGGQVEQLEKSGFVQAVTTPSATWAAQ